MVAAIFACPTREAGQFINNEVKLAK